MRIVCQSCAATYAIDDRLIGSRGVKAQCPKCRHAQPVTKGAPAEEVVFTAPKAAPPVLATGPRCRDCGVELVDAFDLALGVCDACQGRRNARRSAPAVAVTTARAERVDVPAPSAELAASRDLLFDPPGSELRGRPAPAARPDHRAAVPPRAPDPEDEPFGARELPFDPSAGRADAAPSGGAATGSVPDPTAGLFDDVALPSGDAALEVEARPGPTPLGRMSAPLGERRTPPRGSAPARPEAQPALSAARTGQPPRSRGRTLFAAGGVVVLVAAAGGGYLLWRTRAEQAQRAAKPPPVPGEISAVLPHWKLAFVDLEGTAADALAAGEAALAEDHPTKYGEAEEHFQRALLLDPQSDRAIAGYALALAFGRGALMGAAVADEAESLLDAARKRSKDDPLVLAAQAHLWLSRPKPPPVDEVRLLAQRAVDAAKGKDRAFALLALGRTYVQTSSGLAARSFDEALSVDPALHRALLYRAMAEARGGELTEAMATLQSRLELAPEQPEALAELAQLYQEIGEAARARTLYEKVIAANPQALRPVVALAALHYQNEDRPGQAAILLRGLVQNASRYDSRELVEVHVHLAAVERRLGRLEAAARAVQAAAELAPDDPAVRAQSVWLALARERPSEAAEHLGALSGALPDPSLEKLLVGRVRLAEGKLDEATRAFTEAAALNGRLDARLLAGIASARDGDRDGALRAMHLVARADPTRLAPQRLPTRFFVDPTEALRGTGGTFRGLATDDQDALARVYEGLLRFHQGDHAGALRSFDEALRIDGDEPVANAYSALVELERGRKDAAEQAARRAMRRGRQLAIAHLALGRALSAQGKLEDAGRALREAIALEPKLLAAEVALAEVEAAEDKADAARTRLQRVIGLDPTHSGAKRALYRLDRAEATR